LSSQYRGWLKNPERRKRQKKSLAFTERHVQGLLDKIDSIPEYVKPTLGPEIDRLLRLRDKAIISTGWIWFKRASEFLGIKRKDVQVTDSQILVTFTIKKKVKRFKICPVCETKSGYRAKFCRECKTGLKDVEVQGEKEDTIVTKRKTLKNRFVQHIINWLNEFDKLTENLKDSQEAWFFPALKVVFNSGYLKYFSEKPMTVQNLNHILQRLDPTITSSFFRYFRTEQLLTLGYTERELKQIGDWSSSRMPEIYAERKGLTPAQRRFAEDTR
jgi:integrase